MRAIPDLELPVSFLLTPPKIIPLILIIGIGNSTGVLNISADAKVGGRFG